MAFYCRNSANWVFFIEQQNVGWKWLVSQHNTKVSKWHSCTQKSTLQYVNCYPVFRIIKTLPKDLNWIQNSNEKNCIECRNKISFLFCFVLLYILYFIAFCECYWHSCYSKNFISMIDWKKFFNQIENVRKKHLFLIIHIFGSVFLFKKK